MKRYFEYIKDNEAYYRITHNDNVYTVKQDKDRLWQRVSPIDDTLWYNEVRTWLLQNPAPKI